MSDFETGSVAVTALDGVAVTALDGVAVTALAGIAKLWRGFQKSDNAAMGQKVPFVDGQ